MLETGLGNAKAFMLGQQGTSTDGGTGYVGGVREIFYMEKGREVAFLSKRQGFVKLAIQQGVDIIPCFAFGQTASYDWWKPGPPIVPLKLVHWVR